MIVPLRLLYLIFGQLLALLMLLARASASKNAELLVLPTRSQYCAEPPRSHAWTGPTERCSLR
jgi:hypothetical protein